MSEKRDLSDFIEDILVSISDIETFTKNMSFEDFAKDKKTVYAVIRCLEVLGEATKRIPKTIRAKHPEVPWDKMAGLRDVLIHDYMGVDLKTVWKVVEERLNELKPLIEKFSAAQKQ